MATPGEEQYSVVMEWLDPQSNLIRKFHGTFFAVDSTIQLFDVANKRVFLKRVAPPEGVKADDLFIGNTVTVYSRKMKVVEYADGRTAKHFAATRTRSLCIVPAPLVRRLPDVLQGLTDAGIDTARLQSIKFSSKEAAAFGAIGRRKGVAAALTGGTSVAIELVSADCVVTAQTLASTVAGLIVSASDADAAKETAFCFEQPHDNGAIFRDCSLALIKPHAIKAGLAPKIISAIMAAGVSIAAVRAVQFTHKDACDYLEVYKGVVAEYPLWVEQLTGSPSLALSLVGADVAHTMRELAGPYNPEIAELLRPGTLRASFGVNTVDNAVHVTDLPTDGPLECKFVFHVIA